MELDKLQQAVARFLQDNGIPAVASWPEGDRQPMREPVVLVTLNKMDCQPVGLQNYLGQRLDEQTGQVVEWYGHKANLEFGLEILAAAGAGAEACRALLRKLVKVLQCERIDGLTVRSLAVQEIEFDQKEGRLKLACTAGCVGWLWASGEEAADILDFTLRGEWKV